MRGLRVWFVRLGASLRPGHRDRELTDELQGHLALAIEENVRSGMMPSQARRRALIELGGIAPTSEQCRERERFTVIDSLRRDVRTAVRAIRSAPGLSTTVVLVLALGVGATTAAFAVADHVLIRPLPYEDPNRLVMIWQVAPGGGRVEASPANFRDWRDAAKAFERIAAFEDASANLVSEGALMRVQGASVTGDMFATLGVSALIGRYLTVDDDRDTTTMAVVISERLWRGRFASDAKIAGRSITLDDRSHVIVGVMPATFEFPSRLVDFWIPMQLQPGQYVYGNPFLHTVGRLKPGVSRQQANAEVQAIAAAMARANAAANPKASAIVTTLREEVTPQARLLLWALVGAAICLLLIACTNLANLLLTRGLVRQKELAVRSALGAGRRHLIRQLFIESAVLAVSGGLIGIGIAATGIPTLARLVPTTLPSAEAPPLDVRLLAAAIVTTTISALGFALIPAWRASREVDARALRDGARAGTGRRTTSLRSGLVVAQVGISVLLLVSCGLLLKAMLRVQSTDPGFRPEGVLTLRTTLPVKRYESVSLRHRFFSRVLDGIKALPGVTSAAYTTGLPMVDRARIWVIRVPGSESLAPERRVASLRFISPGFFETLRIALLDGRDVSDQDTQASTPIAVVSKSFAERFWPGQIAVGRRFGVRGQEWTIVGIARDIRVRGLEQSSEPQVYLPEQQMPDSGLSAYVPRDLVVRGDRPFDELVPAIRRIVSSADPQQPISDVQPLADIVTGETAPRRIQVRILTAFAVVAFLLAAIGLNGLLAFNVSRNTREIGVRIAIGADHRAILRMVLYRGIKLASAGVAVGVVLALAAGRLMQTLLAGVSPTDLGSFGGAVALAFTMTTLGSLGPALKAMRVDPLDVMRVH